MNVCCSNFVSAAIRVMPVIWPVMLTALAVQISKSVSCSDEFWQKLLAIATPHFKSKIKPEKALQPCEIFSQGFSVYGRCVFLLEIDKKYDIVILLINYC